MRGTFNLFLVLNSDFHINSHEEFLGPKVAEDVSTIWSNILNLITITHLSIFRPTGSRFSRFSIKSPYGILSLCPKTSLRICMDQSCVCNRVRLQALSFSILHCIFCQTWQSSITESTYQDSTQLQIWLAPDENQREACKN